jgi:hypothetical protein
MIFKIEFSGCGFVLIWLELLEPSDKIQCELSDGLCISALPGGSQLAISTSR